MHDGTSPLIDFEGFDDFLVCSELRTGSDPAMAQLVADVHLDRRKANPIHQRGTLFALY